ncbi:DUF4123 domain-containing protein [Tatumella saanichensis]|uniref:DUF4123 domain-containing protein n=1 Tax=Tatumella saanichensis TaxID=480813 RepID=UPI0004A49253|nr:DUF4123 domain-containing protein [Tatumella saanichensis]
MDNKLFDDVKGIIANSAFGKKDNCFLLIDATLKQYQKNNTLYDKLKDRKSYKVSFNHPELNGALQLSLFPLSVVNVIDNKLLDESINQSLNEIKTKNLDLGEGRSVCGWISTELTGEQLAEEIALSAVQSLATGEEILMRYFDPSVFGLLMPVLDNWQKQQLLRNINTWSFIDGDGVAQVMNGGGEYKKKLNYSLGLTELNKCEMSWLVVINKILRIYRKMNLSNKINETDAIILLFPALRYFYSLFAFSEEDVTEFGLDVICAQKPFYLDEMFERLVSKNCSKKIISYSDVKSKYLTESSI